MFRQLGLCPVYSAGSEACWSRLLTRYTFPAGCASADWIAETHGIAVNITYQKLPGFSCGADMEQTRIPLPKDYVDAAFPVIEEQLAKAGYRLAYMLNRALGD